MTDNLEPDWLVGIGAHVDVELIDIEGRADCMSFDVVPDAEADFGAGFLGVGTPLARAILRQRAGAEVPYEMDDLLVVRVLRVVPGRRIPGPDAADRREVAARAESKANLEEAVRLALTVNVKWGDYDPEGLEQGWEE